MPLVLTRTPKQVVDAFDENGAARSVKNSQMTTLLTEMVNAIEYIQAGGGIIFDTAVEANSSLAYAADTMAWVVGDTAANNGVYGKVGASGTGSWQRLFDLPDTFIGGLNYTYSSATTDADPGEGVFKLNHATPASATALFIDALDARGQDATGEITTWAASSSAVRGTLTIQARGDASIKHIYNISGAVVDGTGYRKLTIAHVSGSGALANGDDCLIVFRRTGDKGETGQVGTESQLDSGTLTEGSLELDLSAYVTGGYDRFRVLLRSVTPSVDGAFMGAQFSDDGGATYEAAGYVHAYQRGMSGATSDGDGSASETYMRVTTAIGSAAGELADITVDIDLTATRGAIEARSLLVDAGVAVNMIARGRLIHADLNAIQFFMSSGNVSCDWVLLGFDGTTVVGDATLTDAKLAPTARVSYAAFGAFPDRSVIEAATVGDDIDRLGCLGYAVAGDTDGDIITYKREASEPSCHARLKVQSADGKWFVLSRPAAGLPVKQAGAKWDGAVTDDSEAMQACIDFGPGKILLPPGYGRINSNLTIPGDSVSIVGTQAGTGSAVFFYGTTFLANSVVAPTELSERRTAIGCHDFSIYRKGTFAGSKCFLLDGFVAPRFTNLGMDWFEMGLDIESTTPGWSVYGTFDHITANVCRFGFKIGGDSSNAHALTHCRHNGAGKTVNATTGAADGAGVNVIALQVQNSNGNKVDHFRVDHAYLAVLMEETIADKNYYNSLIAPRIEDVSYGVEIQAGCDGTALVGGGVTGLGVIAALVDNGTGTVKLGW